MAGRLPKYELHGEAIGLAGTKTVISVLYGKPLLDVSVGARHEDSLHCSTPDFRPDAERAVIAFEGLALFFRHEMQRLDANV